MPLRLSTVVRFSGVERVELYARSTSEPPAILDSEHRRQFMTATWQAVHGDRIVRDPEIMAGKPVIRGTRIPVTRIIAHLAHNPDLDDLFAAYPRLEIEDVQAALDYALEALEADDVPAPV